MKHQAPDQVHETAGVHFVLVMLRIASYLKMEKITKTKIEGLVSSNNPLLLNTSA